jgi:hypothetical protein
MSGATRIAVMFALVCGALAGAVSPTDGAGRGKVSILAWPVPGEVIIDGKKLGPAPLTVTLEGEHEISFADYGSQYLAPPARTLKIGAGDTVAVTGVYRNRFIPHALPDGFSPADSVRIYGVKERPMKDGLIFDYIDGGAAPYLRHGLRETTHAFFKGPGKTTFTLDIYDMGTPAGAQAAFDDEEICPKNPGQPDVGAPAKSYHFEPDYFLYFHKAGFLVYAATNNDSLKTTLDSFAAAVCRNIP